MTIENDELEYLRETAKNLGYRYWKNAGKEKLEAFIKDNLTIKTTEVKENELPTAEEMLKEVQCSCSCGKKTEKKKKEDNFFSKSLKFLGF